MRYMGDGYNRKRYQIAFLLTKKRYNNGLFCKVLAFSYLEKAKLD